MKTVRWMMLGAMLGFVASSAVSCGGPVSKCGPQNCPFGCCDAAGSCQVGSSDAQCGSQGNTCMACSFSQRCAVGTCTTIGANGGGTGQGGGGGTTGGGGGNDGGVTGGGGGTTGGGGGTTGGGGGTTGGGGGTTGGGGGTTGGGGGATGGGGGGACTGCLTGGECLPLEFTDTSACGRNGQTCQQCGPSQACAAGICTTVSMPDAGLTFGNTRVRLVGGNGISNGRLEAFINGAWGQVCDDLFDQDTNGATVVCRDLGFNMGTAATTSGPSSAYVMDDVVCQGTESTLQMCMYVGSASEDCGATESLFIECM